MWKFSADQFENCLSKSPNTSCLECLSESPNTSQVCVMTALEKKTVILVTHQVEFLSQVNKILVIEGGEIIQSGSYKELLMIGTTFEQLVNAHKSSIPVLDPTINQNKVKFSHNTWINACCCTLDCCKNTMSGKEEDVKEHEGVDEDVPEDSEKAMPSPQQEEEAVKSRYGGIMPKKPPLISKDHERAYFDSADWALGKQGEEKPKGPLKALQPKLQPTQQQTRYRKSPFLCIWSLVTKVNSWDEVEHQLVSWIVS